MIARRLLSSAAVLLIAWAVLFRLPAWFYLMVVVGFVTLGMSELFDMIEKKGVFVYRYFGIITGGLIPVTVYLHLGGNYVDLEPILIVFACLFTFILQFVRREKSHDHFISIAVTLLALFYVSWFFSFFLKLKYLPNGGYLVAYLILVTKGGDVAAYFVGRAVGKHKLIPRISPNKTVEGTIGGLLGSIMLAIVCSGMAGMRLEQGLIIGILLGVLGEAGDLAESLIKRDCAVKDSGRLVPGFGGVLDMIDSLLFTAPIFYFYVKII